MPVSDISIVTRFIIGIITQAFEDANWPNPPLMPELPGDEKQGLGFYLYHIQENAHYKNTVPTGRDQPPIKFTSMSLNLYYQMTANMGNGDQPAITEQLLMSIALKALHDNPELTMDDNRFRISLQPVPANDAVHNWTAGSSSMKLSAYYEVSTILLQPEKSILRSGRVLTYGNYIFTEGVPRITSSQSIIEFSIPGEGTIRQVIVQPGQATTGQQIRFLGTGFTPPGILLRLYNARWDEPVIADTGWNLEATPNQVTVAVQKTAILENEGTPIDVLPGMYTAQIVVSKTTQLPGGEIREFKQVSNQFPFVVSPSVEYPGTISSNGGTVTITGYIFKYIISIGGADKDILEDKIDMYFGEKSIKRNVTGSLGDNEFRVIDAGTLELNLAGPLKPGQQLPLRILIEGAESPPRWITVL